MSPIERTVIDPDLLKNLSLDYLKKNVWIPFKRQGTVLDIVINDPHDLEKGLDIRRAFPGYTIRFSVGLRRDIEQYFLVVTGRANGGSITEILGELVAAALRAFLRADPDVIMIGEMRDKETADIAIEASLTGHLVLSTLHTNSAVETVTRLLDMGCDSFNFADAMLGVVAKRLCKRICEQCKEAYHPTRQEYDELVQGYGARYWDRLGIAHNDDWTLYRGRGCDICNKSGFKGRIPLHELLAGSEEIKGLIQSKARTAAILDAAMQEGMTTLVQDGIHKVLRGITVYRQVRAVAMQ